jgi:hypothetical protein
MRDGLNRDNDEELVMVQTPRDRDNGLAQTALALFFFVALHCWPYQIFSIQLS